MKNKKFSIEVIEKGRLSRNESNEIVGGLADKCPSYILDCTGKFMAACAVLTQCAPYIFCVDPKAYSICLVTAYTHCVPNTSGGYNQ